MANRVPDWNFWVEKIFNKPALKSRLWILVRSDSNDMPTVRITEILAWEMRRWLHPSDSNSEPWLIKRATEQNRRKEKNYREKRNRTRSLFIR